jgi:uncharacterized membrane protein
MVLHNGVKILLPDEIMTRMKMLINKFIDLNHNCITFKISVMTQRIISHIAIYLLSVVMIIFGIYHIRNPRNMLAFVPENLPGGINWVYVIGIVLIVAALAFILNKFVKITAYLLALLLIIFVLVIHLPIYKNAGDLDLRQTAFIDILQNLAIAAFALHIAGSADSHGMKY